MSMDYQIAVIGAGIIGASIAAKLVDLGLSVALIERGTAGGRGASSYSGGLVRLYDRDPLLMALAAHSIDLLEEEPFFSAYTPALQRTGMLYHAAPDERGRMQEAITRYASARYPMRLLERCEIGGEPNRISLFEPHACVGNVRQAAAALAGRVRREWLLLEQCELTAIDCLSPRDVRLAIGNTTLRCRAVVIAAGAWSRQWQAGAMQTRAIPLARAHGGQGWLMPVIDASADCYAIPAGPGLVQTGCGPRATADRPEALPAPDMRHVEDACAKLEHLSGDARHCLLDVLPGFDGYTPDGRPLLGWADTDGPVYMATAMCGLGFKLAPAIAQIAAEQLQRHLASETPGLDWAALSPRRQTRLAASEQVAGASATPAPAPARSIQP
jgi:glycine/D-amino acid oxidase-like deaminating enzyme